MLIFYKLKKYLNNKQLSRVHFHLFRDDQLCRLNVQNKKSYCFRKVIKKHFGLTPACKHTEIQVSILLFFVLYLQQYLWLKITTVRYIQFWYFHVQGIKNVSKKKCNIKKYI